MDSTAEQWLIPDVPYVSYEEYLAQHGRRALAAARDLRPDGVLDQLERAGLRGRGGAGFPTARKWRTIAQHPCKTRFVVCNAAEGEPGTFKDRWILRRNPYPVVEGMEIAARTIGARQLFIALKGSFLREIQRVRDAIDEMRDAGALIDLRIDVIEGPEEYLFGEEKALLEVIEGGEPLPREPHYPPYERGLFAKPDSPNPALVNNVETFARVPGIVRDGAAAFRSLGTDDTPGPCVYTICGDVARPGVYEAEAGTSLRTLFYEFAGGPRDPSHDLKLALAGTAAGPIPASRFDTPADFGALAHIGSGLGSAGFIVYDDSRSVPRIAQAVARFLYVESCSQCSACKEGLRRASEALDELVSGGGEPAADPCREATLAARSAPQGNRCYLPVQGSVVLPRLIELFAEEFAEVRDNPATAAQPALPIPKLIDFDLDAGDFVIDEAQRRKRPDWTYSSIASP